MSVRTTTISLILDSTGLVVEHAMWRVTARYIGPAFPRGIKSSCGRPGAGSLPKQSKYGKTNEFSCESEGKHFRQASKVPYLRKARASALQYMPTTRRVHRKKESWLEKDECQMPASNLKTTWSCHVNTFIPPLVRLIPRI